MSIRMIFAGPLRGSLKNWESIRKLVEIYDAQIYVGSQNRESWRPFFKVLGKEHLFETNTCDTYILDDTELNNSTVKTKSNYIAQWSNLYLTYKHFENLFSDEDIIVKLRNDIHLYEPLPLDSIDYKSIYVPSKEFHCDSRFDPEILMNDQIVLGRKSPMSVYFNFPYKFKYPTEAYTNLNTHTEIGCVGTFVHPLHTSCGIEILLRNFLKMMNISLKTFDITYVKA